MIRWFFGYLLVIKSIVGSKDDNWRCPEVWAVSCSCDIPHTLRCTGNGTSSFNTISAALRDLPASESISLLDCTIQNVYVLPGPLLAGVSLHGLVISSGEIRQVERAAFVGFTTPLQALGLPNNLLDTVPTAALAALPSLERLDLSFNKLKKLENASFEGLPNLTFLDLSSNLITSISPNAFSSLLELQTLRLQGNRLRVSEVAAFQGLHLLQEIDLSSNLLAGPLGPTTLPRLAKLQVLSLAHNQLSSVKRGALAGMDNITSLSLHHNQIDVMEDHAFRATTTLVQLNLASNRIIAISGASLAHLTRLEVLDLSHNFLWALTADLIGPLKKLRELHLDDNDISIVAKNVLESTSLQRLTLADNPLNCDCSLIEFAAWLVNSTTLSTADKASAVCATPPSLENGVLQEVSPKRLVCGSNEDADPPAMDVPLDTSIPSADTRVMLHGFQFDGTRISLVWSVDTPAAIYSCDAVYVYEALGSGVSEVFRESKPLKCNSSHLANSNKLLVALPASDLIRGRRYKFCIALLESGSSPDDSTSILGCSDVISLFLTTKPSTPVVSPSTRVFINTLVTNFSSPDSITVSVQLWTNHVVTFDYQCRLTISISSLGSSVANRSLTCTAPSTTFKNLPRGPYQVCATLAEHNSEPHSRCITVHQTEDMHTQATINIIFSVSFFVLSTILFLIIYQVIRKLFQRPKPAQTHQCFLPMPHPENEHSKYIKLHATTML